MSTPTPTEVVVWDYAQYPGPWCVSHRSVQCEHALDAIRDRTDAHYIEEHLGTFQKGSRFKVMVPLWPAFFMWEDLMFELQHDPIVGPYGKLIDRGQHATYDLGVSRLLRGESAADLSMVMVQQFTDIMDLDRPARLPGCKSGAHTFAYQKQIERLTSTAEASEEAMNQLLPHLYSLIGRTKPMCAFCWADSFGSDARRVSGVAKEQAKVDDFADLLFEG